MKKSLLALAVLGAFAGAASAQSSVTIGGFIDQGVGKAIGSANKSLLDSGGSRLYFKGTEDLGGGTAAIFNIEHRLDPASGASSSGTTFWNGRSTVGLQGAFGTLELGRDYTVAFLMAQNQIDPFGGDTVANLRDTGMRVAGITTVRSAAEVEYHFSANGFNFGADIAGSNENGRATRPYSLAANYAAGPLFVAAGYEYTGRVAGASAAGKEWDIGARYNLGFATLSAGYSQGDTAAGAKVKGALIGAVIPVGAGDVKVGYAKQGSAAGTAGNKLGLGYHYNLSKRTKIYADVANDSKAKSEKTGYDLGLRVSF